MLSRDWEVTSEVYFVRIVIILRIDWCLVCLLRCASDGHGLVL